MQHEYIPQLPNPLQLPHFISSHRNCVKEVSIYIFFVKHLLDDLFILSY